MVNTPAALCLSALNGLGTMRARLRELFPPALTAEDPLLLLLFGLVARQRLVAAPAAEAAAVKLPKRRDLHNAPTANLLDTVVHFSN